MSLRTIPQVLQSDPELRNGMMHVLMARLEDSYTRLNMVKKMKTRCQVRQRDGRVFRCIVHTWILVRRDRPRWTSPDTPRPVLLRPPPGAAARRAEHPAAWAAG